MDCHGSPQKSFLFLKPGTIILLSKGDISGTEHAVALIELTRTIHRKISKLKIIYETIKVYCIAQRIIVNIL